MPANRAKKRKHNQKPAHHLQYPKAEPGRKIADHPAARTLSSGPRNYFAGWWELRFDGGVDRNGSADCSGRWAFTLHDGRRLVAAEAGSATGAPVTVNTCEWQGLHAGLLALLPLRAAAPGVLIEGDSDLVISQLTGAWSAKQAPLLDWRNRCLDLLAELYAPWFARWIPREQNTVCDAMTKRR
jgi:ribonuclease HI